MGPHRVMDASASSLRASKLLDLYGPKVRVIILCPECSNWRRTNERESKMICTDLIKPKNGKRFHSLWRPRLTRVSMDAICIDNSFAIEECLHKDRGGWFMVHRELSAQIFACGPQMYTQRRHWLNGLLTTLMHTNYTHIKTIAYTRHMRGGHPSAYFTSSCETSEMAHMSPKKQQASTRL